MKRVYTRLNANLKVDTGSGRLGVIDSLGTGLDVWAYTVVVAGSECGPITQTMDGDGVVRSAEADSTRVTGEATLCDVVGSLGTEKESVTTEDSVGGECRSLKRRYQHISERYVYGRIFRNLEDVKESTGVKSGLLIDGSEQGRLGTLFWQQSGSEVEFQTLGDLVLELDLGAKHVRGRPGLGESETVVLEVVFGLEVTGDSSLGVPEKSDLEGHAGRRGGLDLK